MRIHHLAGCASILVVAEPYRVNLLRERLKVKFSISSKVQEWGFSSRAQASTMEQPEHASIPSTAIEIQVSDFARF